MRVLAPQRSTLPPNVPSTLPTLIAFVVLPLQIVHGGVTALTFDNLFGMALFLQKTGAVVTAYLKVCLYTPVGVFGGRLHSEGENKLKSGVTERNSDQKQICSRPCFGLRITCDVLLQLLLL